MLMEELRVGGISIGARSKVRLLLGGAEGWGRGPADTRPDNEDPSATPRGTVAPQGETMAFVPSARGSRRLQGASDGGMDHVGVQDI